VSDAWSSLPQKIGGFAPQLRPSDAPPGESTDPGGRLLRVSLILAIVIHGAILVAFAVLPSFQARGVNLETIRVFGSDKASFLQPVSMVQIQEQQQGHAIESAAIRTLVAIPVRPREIHPANQPGTTFLPRTPSPNPGHSSTQTNATRQTALPAPTTNNASNQSASQTNPGGGGGATQIQPAVIHTTGPDIPSAGQTSPGDVPGMGSGSGSGSGTGSGGGTGSGNGSGNGSGTDSDPHPGEDPTNTGNNTKPPDNGGSGFQSTLADRSDPKIVSTGRQTYPKAAADDGIEGTVILKVLVNETGNVEEATVLTGSGDKRLDRAAIEYVSHWKYLPAVQDGKPRRVMTKARVAFKLQ
jgi:TonB family protein